MTAPYLSSLQFRAPIKLCSEAFLLRLTNDVDPGNDWVEIRSVEHPTPVRWTAAKNPAGSEEFQTHRSPVWALRHLLAAIHRRQDMQAFFGFVPLPGLYWADHFPEVKPVAYLHYGGPDRAVEIRSTFLEVVNFSGQDDYRPGAPVVPLSSVLWASPWGPRLNHWDGEAGQVYQCAHGGNVTQHAKVPAAHELSQYDAMYNPPRGFSQTQATWIDAMGPWDETAGLNRAYPPGTHVSRNGESWFLPTHGTQPDRNTWERK